MITKFILLLLAFTNTLLWAGTTQVLSSTKKETCVNHSEHLVSNSELKKILMEQVKRDAVEELFGAKLESETTIVDGRLQSDRIKQSAVGKIRVKGTPEFYNGKGFGEMCTKIEAYITQEDYETYQPQTVTSKHFCYNNPNVSLKSLKSEASYAAYRDAITKFKPKLKNITNTSAESFIHGFEKSKETLDIQTGVLCFDYSATLLPYELEGDIDTNSADSKSDSTHDSQKGLLVTFYANGDYGLKKPLYTTQLSQDISLFSKSFLNAKLKKNQAYYIQLKGFLYSPVDRYANFKLESDVYNIQVKLNNKRVVNKHETKGGVGLKMGYNPIEILLTSSNAYDFKLLEKQSDGSYTPLSISKLNTKEN
ncbi:MAG: hypothetical protein U9O86_02990 [Campylobacterota bacterium]|nr:hypothetical protein [Campylobacterota bacterium]